MEMPRRGGSAARNRRKNEGKKLGKKHMELSERRRAFTRKKRRGKRTVEEGAERLMVEWIAAEKVRAGLRHAVGCPNVTGRTKDSIVQHKRVRAGSLAIVD